MRAEDHWACHLWEPSILLALGILLITFLQQIRLMLLFKQLPRVLKRLHIAILVLIRLRRDRLNQTLMLLQFVTILLMHLLLKHSAIVTPSRHLLLK